MMVEVGIWVETQVKSDLYFPLWAWQNGSRKEGWEKGRSVTVGSDQRICYQHSQTCAWGGFQELCPSGTQIWKFAKKEMRTPDKLGQRNKECAIPYLGAIVQKM